MKKILRILQRNHNLKKKGKFSDIFFEEEAPTGEEPKKRKGIMDVFFEEEPEDPEEAAIKSTFFSSEEMGTSLSDISTQIAQRESELIKLASYFRTVDPKEFTDSKSEYEAYLSLINQLNAIKTLCEADKTTTVGNLSSYQLESSYRKFESDYNAHIGAIQSLCYLSELSATNAELESLFSTDFTNKTMARIADREQFVGLISKKRKSFDKKYSPRLYKELMESEYRLTILKLMIQLKQFLSFKLNLNYLDSKTPAADQMLLNEHHRRVTGKKTTTTTPRRTSGRPTSGKRQYPDFDDDF